MRQLVLVLLLLEFLFPHRLFAASANHRSLPPENRAWFENPLIDLVKPYDLNDIAVLSRRDVAVDRDPFFLRSQQWESGTFPTDENSEVSYETFSGGITISVHGVSGSLTLHQPLVPVAATAEHLILASQDQKLFSQKTSEGAEDGEGLFAISFDEFTSASVKERKVPVYFLPLPGSGWVGQVSGIEVPEQELLVLRATDGDSIPLEISDIQTMVKVGQANLILSYALALRAQTRFREPGSTEPLPPTLSTAAFGLVFTGLHGENPGASLFPQQQNIFRSSWRQMPELLGIWYQEGRALADPWMSFTEIFEQLLPKMTHVGSIVGLLTVGAIVLKYTLYRSKYVPEEQKFHPWREFYAREMEAWKHNLSIFGHAVNFLATAPYVFSGNPAQFMADRFFTKLAAGENSLVRRMLKFFVGRATDNNRNLALNDDVVKGAIAKAGIDTFCVAYQLYFFVPHMLHTAADHFPDLKPRVDQILSKTGGEAATFALEETAYVGVNHLTSGATEYASVAAANALQRAAVEVDEEMRMEPKQAQWEEERARRIEARKKTKLAEAGLGKPDEFLFDAQTVFTSLVSMFGYAPEGAWKNERATGESRETYAAEERFGLILPSLAKALETAKALQAEHPQDEEVRQAVELLTTLNTESRYFSQYVRQPWNIWKQLKEGKGFLGRLREVRRQLLKLTYVGAVRESEVKNLPENWKDGRSPGAARVAAMCFQNAFFAYKEGSPSLNDRVTSDHPLFRKSPGDAVKRQFNSAAAHQLQFLYPQEYDELFAQMKSPEECSTELRRRHPVQHHLILARMINVAYDKKIAEDKSYEDPVKGWFAKWQMKRARSQALRAFAKQTRRKYLPNSSSEDDQRLWQRLYAEKMMRQMGMIPVFDEKAAPGLQQAVETMASGRFNEFLKSSQVQEFVSHSTNGSEFLDRMRAIFTAHAYLDVTTQTNLVAPTSPAQPGIFQRLRNSKLVRSLPGALQWPLAVATRFMEAATHSDGHHLGLANWFRRNVPVFTDLKEGLLRTMQLSLIYLSVVWMWNYLFWHIEMPWYMHASSFLIGYPLVVGPQLFLQRAFKNIGWKPNETFKRRVVYAFVYSWATFLGYPLTQYFEPDAKQLVESASSFFMGEPVQAAELPQGDASCAAEIANRQ